MSIKFWGLSIIFVNAEITKWGVYKYSKIYLEGPPPVCLFISATFSIISFCISQPTLHSRSSKPAPSWRGTERHNRKDIQEIPKVNRAADWQANDGQVSLLCNRLFHPCASRYGWLFKSFSLYSDLHIYAWRRLLLGDSWVKHFWFEAVFRNHPLSWKSSWEGTVLTILPDSKHYAWHMSGPKAQTWKGLLYILNFFSYKSQQ